MNTHVTSSLIGKRAARVNDAAERCGRATVIHACMLVVLLVGTATKVFGDESVHPNRADGLAPTSARDSVSFVVVQHDGGGQSSLSWDESAIEPANLSDRGPSSPALSGKSGTCFCKGKYISGWMPRDTCYKLGGQCK